jgi:hypothetical protein
MQMGAKGAAAAAVQVVWAFGGMRRKVEHSRCSIFPFIDSIQMA